MFLYMKLSIFEKILYFIMLPVVAIGSIMSPLTNDVRIFYGVEYLDWKYITPFPQNINYFWEIKPIMNHIINYALVVFTCALVPFENHFTQEIIVKSIIVLSVIVASWLFSRNILKMKYSFLLCSFGILCSLNLNQGQAEFWSLILAMIAAALLVEENKLWHYVSGILLMFAFLTKGTTACLVVSAICALIVLNKKVNWARVITGFVGMGVIFLIANFTIWKTLLSDIILAPMLSHVGEYSMMGQVIAIIIATIIAASIYIPCVGIGGTYGLIWIKNHLKDPRIYAFTVMWGIVFFITWGQGETFAYQFFPLVLPAIVSLILFEKETPRERPTKKIKRENIVAATIVLLFGMYCIFYAPVISYYGSQEKTMNDYFWNQSQMMNSKLDLQNQSSVLYMDTGSLPYYTNGVNSSCRYVAPLVLQRANPGRLIVSNLSQYWDAYNCTMNYQGRYILADGPLGKSDGWFGTDSSEKVAIVNKVHSEYNEVFDGAWTVYERKNESVMLNLT